MSKLSEILGVKEEQEFKYDNDDTIFRISGNYLMRKTNSQLWVIASGKVVCNIIAHSNLIKPIPSKPKLTKQQITAIKGRIAEGTPWVAKDKKFFSIWFYSDKPIEDSGVFKCIEDRSRQTMGAPDLYSFVSYKNSPIYLPDLIEEKE